jgi:hypothetical protein
MQATATRSEARPRSGKRKRTRSDALPEFMRYRDDGCDIHDHCLTCPLPRCRYEEPGGLRALLNEQRDRQMDQLRRKGASVNELAGRFGVSRRTVFRVLGSSKASRRDTPIAVIPAEIALAVAKRTKRGAAGDGREESRCA